MGMFDWLRKKKAAPPDLNEKANTRGPTPTRTAPIEGPPEFVRAVELQMAYWTHDAEEQGRLWARGLEKLTWRELLRLHHLVCLELLQADPESEVASEKCEATARRLCELQSPYRPRAAMVWQQQATAPAEDEEPHLQGLFLNASLTHLGCLEVFRLDKDHMPTGIEFVSFDELSGVAFARPTLIRAAQLHYEDGRAEVVAVPLLYGLTWTIGDEDDRDGGMTKFVAHLASEEMASLGASGMGVGQQDFTISSRDGGRHLFGLASIAELTFPLDMSDPRFDEKARTRGLDPDEIRRQMR